MTHADILVQMIAEQGRVTIEEARFVFESFRATFPGPEYLDRELSPAEAEFMAALYRENQMVLQWIAQTMLRYHDELPSA